MAVGSASVYCYHQPALSTATVLLAQLRDRGDPGSNPVLIHTAVFIPRSASRKAIGPEVKW